MSDACFRNRVYKKYLFSRGQGRSRQENLQLQIRAFRHFYRGWLPDDANAVIADLACGDGDILGFFKELGYVRISGADINCERVAVAREITTDVQECSVQSFLSERTEYFDLITANNFLEHLSKDEVFPFLDSCYRALKPGGYLILQTPNASSPWACSIRYDDFTHEIAFTPNCLSNIQELSGYCEIEMREMGPIPFGYSFRSSVRAVGWSVLKASLLFWNLVETGSLGTRILSRVFLTRARKPL